MSTFRLAVFRYNQFSSLKYPQCIQRQISTSAKNLAEAKSNRAVGVRPSAGHKVIPTSGRARDAFVSRGIYNPVVGRLITKSSPTILYQSRSKAGYVTGCFLMGGFCFTYAAFNGWNVIYAPTEDLSIWVTGAISGVCVAMLFFGSYAIFKSYRIVRRITAIPQTDSRGRHSLALGIESGIFRPRSMIVPHQDIILSDRLYSPSASFSPTRKVFSLQEEARKRQIELSRILTLPFRQASYWTWRGFKAFQSFFVDDGWVYMKVKGRNGAWKIDKHPAWVLDSGKSIDELVKQGLEHV